MRARGALAAALATALGTVLVLIAACVVITAVISPLVLAGLHAAGLSDAALDAVLLRVLELVAIALTFPLLWRLGGGGRADWGIPPRAGVIREVGAGFLIGAATLIPVSLVLFMLDVRVTRYWLEPDILWWLKVLFGAFLSATIIAITEELWFRGGLFSAFQRAGGAAVALGLSSVIYAGAHFLELPEGATMVAGPGVADALSLLWQATGAVFRMENLDSFIALVAAGIALGLVRLRRGHVALAIGIHAGWVFVIKVFKKYTYILPEGPLRALAGTYDDFIGWTAAVALVVLVLALWWRLPRVADREAAA